MKALYIILIVSLLFSCSKEELPEYSGKDFIFFGTLDPSKDDTQIFNDTTIFSFVNKMVAHDVVFHLGVRVGGFVSEIDRLFKAEIVQTDAKEGFNFDPIDPLELLIKAGDSTGFIPIKINFTDDILDTTYFIKFKLFENEHFSLDMPVKKVYGDSINILEHTLLITAQVQKPSTWFDYYMGYYSPHKLLKMNEVLGYNMDAWKDFSTPLFRNINRNMVKFSNYLRFKINEGQEAAIKDPHPDSLRGYMAMPDTVIPSDWEDMPQDSK